MKNKYSYILALLTFLDLIFFTKQNYTIYSLFDFSPKTVNLNMSENYIFYLDIQDYKIGDENVLQILCNDIDAIKKIILLEIDESIINKENEIINEENINIIKNISEKNIKKKLYMDKYYFDILIKKTNKNQKLFCILLNTDLENNNFQIELYVSSIIPNFYLYEDDIDKGKIFTQVFYMDHKIEKFFKFNLINISLEESNLIFYISDKKVSNFLIGNITSNNINGQILVIEKNSTRELNHTIYLSLIGEFQSTEIQIAKDYHDIKYYYNSNREDTSQYIERLNCNKDFYIIENYQRNNLNYYLNTVPFYGDYKLVYYEEINGSNINDIFIPNNEIEIDKKVKKIDSFFNILKLSCKTSTLLKIKYFNINNKISEIIEGEEIISYNEKNQDNIILNADNSLKKYTFFLGIYENTERYNYTRINFFFKEYKTLDNRNRTQINQTFQIFHQILPNNKFSFYIQIPGYLKIFLISNLYYKNIVEGLTEITPEAKNISFKLKKDIIFDYFIIKIYSHNKEKLVSVSYEFKIVESDNIVEGYPYVSINPIKIFNKTEIIMRFSNPYDKFNSQIKENDYIYFLASFNICDENSFPLYIDIRYYSKDSIFTIEQSMPKIILNEKEYKILGYKNFTEKNKILINVNKCNLEKNYIIKSYYENDKNIIAEDEIYRRRNILFHDNLYNNTKFILCSNDSSNISNNKNSNLLKASYYEDGDIYMNYFAINESLYNSIKINENYKISYKDNKKEIELSWPKYIINKEIISNLKINYSLYILPYNSPINSTCQLSLIPPNVSMINKNNYEIDLSKGEYKIAILASIINNEFPLTTYYDILKLDVPTRVDIALIIIIIISISAVIAIIVIFLYCKKKLKKDEDGEFSRKSKIISMANIFGYYDEQEEELLQNEEGENNSKEKENEKENNKIDDDSAFDDEIVEEL